MGHFGAAAAGKEQIPVSVLRCPLAGGEEWAILDSAPRANSRVDRFAGDRTCFFGRSLQVFKHLN